MSSSKFAKENKGNPICNRIVEIQGKLSNKELADLIKVSPSTLFYYLNGRIPPADFVNLFCEKLNVDANWLLTGEGPMYREEQKASLTSNAKTVHQKEDDNEESIRIPLYDVRASAGHGTYVDSEYKTDDMLFDKRWILYTMRLQPEKLSVISVMGDSMEPTLQEKDLVLVDHRYKKAKTDGVYVVNYDDMLLIKRVQSTPEGLYIRSDNHLYKEVFVSTDTPKPIKIIGRVVWVGKRL